MKKINPAIFIALGSVVLGTFFFTFKIISQAPAFPGPSTSPYSSFGFIKASTYDAAIGVQSPRSTTTLLITGSDSTSNNFSLKVENLNLDRVIKIRNNQVVTTGKDIIPSDPGAASMTHGFANPSYFLQAETIYSPAANINKPGFDLSQPQNSLFVDNWYVNTALQGFPGGTSEIRNFNSIQANQIFPDLTPASNVIGYSGSAPSSPGVFGVQTGIQNYAFPAKLGVGTTTVLSSGLPEALTVQGGAYLTGYLGIGKVPTVALDIAGLSTSTGRINFRSGLAETTYGEIYGDANGVTISSRNATANYGLHFNLESEQMRITTTGVGIGVFPPTSKLDVAGTIKSTGLDTTGNTKATAFQLTTNPINGYILTSDALGNGTWQSAADLLPSGSQHQTLRHSGFGWVASSFLINTDTGIGINTTPIAGTYLEVGSGGYLQFDKFFNGAPLAADCDNNLERGRLTLDYVNLRFYVCTGATGWKFFKLQ